MMLIRKGTGEDPRLIEKDKVPYLEFEALKKQSWLTHAFSTRLGGVSSGCFASMNLGFGRGEEDKIVAENYKRLGEQWVLTGKKWSCPIRLILQMYAL